MFMARSFAKTSPSFLMHASLTLFSVDFGLDQICRGCGNCSDCVTCPSGSIPSAADSTQTSAASLLTPDSYDCSTCFNLTTAQNEELTNSDDGEKTIVCDLTCLDGVSDPIHCNCKYICQYDDDDDSRK